MEDEVNDENYEKMSNEGANKGTFFFLMYITCLRYASMWKSASVNFLSVS